MLDLKNVNIDDIKKYFEENPTQDMDFILDVIDTCYDIGFDNGEKRGFKVALSNKNGQEFIEDDYREHNEAYQNGYNNGYDNGFEIGHREGYSLGFEEGFNTGNKEGYVNEFGTRL
jgi:flagellar biosynthesis/type III secretory pathway protein FliH